MTFHILREFESALHKRLQWRAGRAQTGPSALKHCRESGWAFPGAREQKRGLGIGHMRQKKVLTWAFYHFCADVEQKGKRQLGLIRSQEANIKTWSQTPLSNPNQSYFCILLLLLCSVVSDSLRPHGLQTTSLLCPWDFPGKVDYWSGLTFPPPGHLPDSGIEPASPEPPALAG